MTLPEAARPGMGLEQGGQVVFCENSKGEIVMSAVNDDLTAGNGPDTTAPTNP